MKPKRYPHNPALIPRARELRRPLTIAEKKLWDVVRNRGLGYKIRRQEVIEHFIADFYCAQARLVIEVDGGIHFTPEQMVRDEERTKWFVEHGYEVIRFTNTEVKNNLAGVVQVLVEKIEARIAEIQKGEG